jgi:outer membrane protein, adhesin transport system
MLIRDLGLDFVSNGMKSNNKFEFSCALVLAALAMISASSLAQPLERVVAEVVRLHPKLSSARAGALGVQAEIEVAQAALNPKLNFSGGGGRGYSFSNGGVSAAGDIIAQGVYPLYDGRRSLNEISRQEYRFLTAQQKADQVRDQLIAIAVDAYIEVGKQEALMKLAADNVQAHQDLMNKVLEIVKLDRGRGVDATQVAVRLQQAKVNLNAQRNAHSEARAVLADLLGRNDYEALAVKDPSSSMPKNLLEANTWLGDHPTMKAAQSDARVSDYAAQIAAAWAKPRVDVLGTLSNPQSAVNSRYFSNFDVRLGVQWSAFDGGAGRAAERAASLQKVAAEEQIKAVLKDLASDVSRTWSQMRSREGRFTEFVDLALRAREVREAYWEQFRIGRRSILDLLNAENEGFQASLNAEQVRQEMLQYQYRVLSSTGRLSRWLELDEPVVNVGAVPTKN